MSSADFVKKSKEVHRDVYNYSKVNYIIKSESKPVVVKTKEQVKKYWLKNGITNSKKWVEHCKENNLQEYGTQPWVSFSMSSKEWVEYVVGKK